MTQEVKRKRQARGEARIQSLLMSAEAVFARAGYSKATTNEIAAEAGVSPATLYQFFKNKEEIADAVAMKYVDEIGQLHESADYKSMAKLPMKRMVAALLNPFFNFHDTHPAFLPLLLDAPLSAETRKAKHAMSQKFIERMSHLLMMREPNLSKNDAVWDAEIVLLLFKGFIHEIHEANGKRKDKLTESLIDLIAGRLSDSERH